MMFKSSTMSGKCPRCKEKCHVAEARVALDEWWHNDCFTCAICHRALDSVSLYECYDAQEVFCRQCYRRHCSINGYGYGAALISDNGKTANVKQEAEKHENLNGFNSKYATKATVQHSPSSNSRNQQRSKPTQSINSILEQSSHPNARERVPTKTYSRNDKSIYNKAQTINTQTQGDFKQSGDNIKMSRKYIPAQQYSSFESTVASESVKSEITGRSKARKHLIPAFSKQVLPPPPPLEGYWNSLTNLNNRQVANNKNVGTNQITKSKSSEVLPITDNFTNDRNFERHGQNRNNLTSKATTNVNNFNNWNDLQIRKTVNDAQMNSVHGSDSEKLINAEIDDKLNIAINVKGSPGTIVLIGPNSQENFEKVWKNFPSQSSLENYKVLTDVKENQEKSPKISIESPSLLEAETENPNSKSYTKCFNTPKSNFRVGDGLVTLSYSDPIHSNQIQLQEPNDGIHDEDAKSFGSFNSNKYSQRTVQEEASFTLALAAENKKLSKRETSTTAIPGLDSLDEDYNKLETTIIKPQAIEVKSSISELNRSFEHMKSLSKSKLQLNITNSRIFHIDKNEKSYCRGCGMEIQRIETNIITLTPDLTWHLKCFACSKCYIKLNERNYFLKEKWLFCTTHYAEAIHAPKCEACQQYILESSYTIAKGRPWHRDHFKCSNCKIPIIDSKYVTLFLKQVVCFICYEKYFSKNCQTCEKRIKATEQFIYHNQYYWHAKDECLNCHTCRQSLVGRQVMFFKEGIPYCSKYCAIRQVD